MKKDETANAKGDMDGQTQEGKRRIAMVLFEDLLAYQFAKVQFCCL